MSNKSDLKVFLRTYSPNKGSVKVLRHFLS
jgi:hypothetical protein